MQQLTNMDAGWLYGESKKMPFHVANLHFFDKPQGRVDVMAALRKQVHERLATLPLLHRKLDLRSYQLGSPVWIDAPELDMDYHVQRVTVAKPGGQKALNDTVAELHQPLMDRRYPLWQLWLIDGLADGGYALYMKLHHAAVDGGSASLVVDGLLGAKHRPQGQATGALPAQEQPVSLNALAWNTARDAWLTMPGKLVATTREMARQRPVPGETPFGIADMVQLSKPTPRTVFNTGLSEQRRWGSASLSLSEVKRFGKAHGATINDVVLAVITGALRRYLGKHGALGTQALVAGVPVSVRGEGDTAHNNQVSLMLARLPVQLEDARQWMPVVRTSMQAAKRLQDAARPVARLQVEMPSLRIPMVNNLASLMEGLKAAESMGTEDLLPPLVNLWVSNVPGPREPLYIAGQVAKSFYPVALLMHGAALNVTVISYLDRMDFGVLACPKAVDDAQELADLLAIAFEAFKAALDSTNPAEKTEETP